MPTETSTRFYEGSCEIILNRPNKLNALNLEMIRCLHRALDRVDEKAGQERVDRWRPVRSHQIPFISH